MNIVQIQQKVKSRLDQINTPRFETFQIDNTINTAIDNIIRYKMSGVIENGKRVSFQKTKIIRDELYTIVKKRSNVDANPIIITNNIISGLPSDTGNIYRYLLLLQITVNGVLTDFCVPTTYDDFAVLKRNPYNRPSKDYPFNFYYIESSSGLECQYNQSGSDAITAAEIHYISQPAVVDYGTEVTSTYAFDGVKKCIAVTTCVMAGTTYKKGVEWTPGNGVHLTSGTAVIDYVNTDLPLSLHEEIVTEAAKMLNADVENFDKWKVMEESDQLKKK